MYSFKYFYSLRLLKSWSPLETDDNDVCWQISVYQFETGHNILKY